MKQNQKIRDEVNVDAAFEDSDENDGDYFKNIKLNLELKKRQEEEMKKEL